MQVVKSAPYKGKRMRLTAWVKTGSKTQIVTLWMGVSHTTTTSTPGVNNLIKGMEDWQQCSLVMDVDTSSDYMEYGVILPDSGKVWIDDVTIEQVDKSVPVTVDIFKTHMASTNLSFENVSQTGTPENWWGTININGYTVKSDRAIFHDGALSACLSFKNQKISKADWGTITGSMKPDSFKGHRVRMSGWLKTDSVSDWAGLWMRVDGKDFKQVLAFDNMQERGVKGTTDWKKYEIVLEVPQDATNINFGALLCGKGKLWLDEIKFEIVGNDIPSTSTYTSKGKHLSAGKIKKLEKERADNAHDILVNGDFEG